MLQLLRKIRIWDFFNCVQCAQRGHKDWGQSAMNAFLCLSMQTAGNFLPNWCHFHKMSKGLQEEAKAFFKILQLLTAKTSIIANLIVSLSYLLANIGFKYASSWECKWSSLLKVRIQHTKILCLFSKIFIHFSPALPMNVHSSSWIWKATLQCHVPSVAARWSTAGAAWKKVETPSEMSFEVEKLSLLARKKIILQSQLTIYGNKKCANSNFPKFVSKDVYCNGFAKGLVRRTLKDIE